MQMEQHYQQISAHNNHSNSAQSQQIHNQQMPSQPATPIQQSQTNDVDLSVVKQEVRPKKKSKAKQKQQQQQQMGKFKQSK